MATKMRAREYTSVRIDMPAEGGSRSKGRNGWFTPRIVEARLHAADDGTPMITLRQYSRRAPEGEGAPLECTLPMAIYREIWRQVNGAAPKVLTKQRRGQR
jgi:hypothetical protein